MQREIFEVYAKVVDANGTYNTLTGYPMVFDSRNYNNDIGKTMKRAEGAWHECIGAMSKNDTRQLQICMLIRASDGAVVRSEKIGEIAEIPDPTETEEE